MKSQKGFTIIELIVVIAIIAVLAAIVLVNVTQYISKGKNSAIKGDMSTISTNAAVYFDGQSPSTYIGFCTGATPSSTCTTPVAAAVGNGATGTCGTDSKQPCEYESLTAYCVTTTLNSVSGDTNWCVDSTGYSGVPTAVGTCSATNIACQ